MERVFILLVVADHGPSRLVAQGYTQEEGIDYDEVFAPVTRIEAIRVFLAYASFKDFMVYQMDVKSAFLYEKIEENVYVCQPPGFEDPDFPDRVYKVEKALRDKGDILLVQVYVDDIIFGSTKKELCNAFEKLMHEKFQMSSMGELTFFLGLQVKQKNDGIFISQDKYVAEILKKFGYLKGQPKLGLWYPKDSPFDLVAYTDSDYAGASLDRKSTTGGFQFLGCRLISWQCKKQTVVAVVANSATEAEYVAASSCYLLTKAFDYALTVKPTIYISGIEQFWTTAKVKTINGEAQLHARVDGKKIIITETSVRRDLQLADENGIDCLPNATIFEQLTLTGPKTTAWNEFSSTMASAIIFLATNQKFNFSKLIFESMMKNLDNVSGKFLMYPRFVQVFLDQQLDDMSIHKRIYVAPSHTKNIFENMRRVGKDFFGNVTHLFPTMMVQAQQEHGEGSAMPTAPQHTPAITQPSTTQPQKTQKPRKPTRKNTEVPQPSGSTDNVADEAVYKELDDSLVRAATTTSSLEAEQDSGNIIKTRSKATPNEPGSQGTSSGGGPRCQETIGDTIAQTRFENVSKISNDPLLIRGNTLRSGEDSLKLNELMELCTKLQQRVLDLENTKTSQDNEIAKLKRRVKKLEQKKRLRTHVLKKLKKVGATARVESSGDEVHLGEDASKQGRKSIDDIDEDDNITLVSTQNVNEEIMFDVSDLAGEEVFVDEQGVPNSKKDDVVSTAGVATTISAAATTVTITPEEITLAQALEELKTAKPKVKGIVFKEPVESTTTTKISSQQPSQAKIQDKGKEKMIEPEPVKKLSKKDQLKLDEEVAQRLQAEFDEQERIEREKAKKEAEANIALKETWDDIQAKIKADCLLAERLQAREQEELTIEERAKLFQQLLEKRRKHFAAKRAEEKRNRPPTRAQ
ncbi:putative ribonuclease H-like domain-containing protein [Tanacetum coccineum]